jgi:hypothetical protein
LCLSLTTFAFADGNDNVITKKTVDEDGSVTISSAMENPNKSSDPELISPNAVYTGEWGLWLAEVFKNPILAYFSGRSRSFTDSTKTKMAEIDRIEVNIAGYHYEDYWHCCASNFDGQNNASEAYCNDGYCDVLLGHKIESSHYFKEGSFTWSPDLSLAA